jgi:hypothetical protein
MEHAAASAAPPRGRWTTLNIVLMVLGFAFFWPFGLAMLAWILWSGAIRRRVDETVDLLRTFTARAVEAAPATSRSGTNGKASFDETAAAEAQRLDAGMREREEFRRFIAEFRRRAGSAGSAEA